MGFRRKVSSTSFLLVALLVFGLAVTFTVVAETIDSCPADDETCRSPLTAAEACEDKKELCVRWARVKECEKNPGFMHVNCRRSCGLCADQESSPDNAIEVCEDEDERCTGWAKIKECEKNPSFMHASCRRSCAVCPDQISARAEIEKMKLVGGDFGVPQDISSSAGGDKTKAVITEAREYLATLTLGKDIMELCKNNHEHCSFWATLGECEVNPKYMKKDCAPACKSCEYLTVEGRCPLDPDAPSSWSPGDLDAMFVRLTNEPYLSQYDTKILSSPNTTGGPWVVTMENVVSQEEADHLIELGAIENYTRSADVGTLKPDGTFDPFVNPGRTSTNAWCNGVCYENATALAVVDRLSEITGINETNSEFLQLLRYEEGQHYQVHHDYIPHHVRRQPGVRILTLYLYLNDVENGGGTNFDKLDLTVMPRRGRALLWPSVFDSDPNAKDDRTTHQALPVGKDSLKFGANAWFHQRDFKGPYKTGCSS